MIALVTIVQFLTQAYYAIAEGRGISGKHRIVLSASKGHSFISTHFTHGISTSAHCANLGPIFPGGSGCVKRAVCRVGDKHLMPLGTNNLLIRKSSMSARHRTHAPTRPNAPAQVRAHHFAFTRHMPRALARHIEQTSAMSE